MMKQLQDLWQQIRDVHNLLFQEKDFLEKALERDGKRDGEEKNREFYEYLVSTAKKGRNEAFCWILASITFGFITTLLVKCTGNISANWLEIGIKLASASVLGFATLNRLKDPKSFDGNTLVETTNTNLFKFLYCFGFGLGVFALSSF